MSTKTKQKGSRTRAPRAKKPAAPFEFQEGDVVKLKSGGPLMTVSNRTVGNSPNGVRDTDVLCLYFQDVTMKSMYFSPRMIHLVPDQGDE